MGYIYKICNDINSKIYIGQTSQTLEERWSQHLQNSKTVDYCLYRAMRKYGSDHFFIQLIEECKDEEINDREVYWIAHYNSYYQGYNETLGGDGNRKYNRNIFLELWNDGLTCKEIASEIGCDSHTVTVWLRACGVSKEDVRSRSATHHYKKVCRYNLQGELIRIFDSVIDVKNFFEYKTSGSACNAIRFHYNIDETILVFESDKENVMKYIRELKNQRKRKPIIQYTTNGILIAYHNSVIEAAQSVEGDPSSIIKVCKKRRIAYKNSLWKYETDDTEISFWVERYKNKKIIGVSWNKGKNKWSADIYTNHHRFHLGYFTNKEDAIRTRLKAESEHLGERAPQKELFEQYGII